MSDERQELTSHHVLARNTLFNLFGQGAPILIALIAIPFLIEALGTDRFGILTLLWVVIGYFSLFDFGLGRALTKLVAEKLGASRLQDVPAIVWTALFLMTIFSIAGALVVGLLSNWFVLRVLKVPEALRTEAIHSFYLLALSLPVVISTVALRGVLEAFQRFELVNVVRIFMGAFTYLGPILILPFSRSLFAVVLVLLIGRLLAWLVHLMLCLKVVPLLHTIVLSRSAVKPLIHFGSWMTVTNIVGPLMVYLDRFIIGTLLTVSAVAYYTTPYEIVTKLWIIPGALAGVLFPAFTTSFVRDSNSTAALYKRAVKYIFLIMFPIALIIVTFANEGLGFWLGNEFSKNSTHVLQWLTAGVFINSISQISFSLLQSMGRPDLTAKLHLIELPFYLLCLWWFILTLGIEGAAMAWALRVAIDALLLFVMSALLLANKSVINSKGIIGLGLSILSIALACIVQGVLLKGIFILLVISIFAPASWLLILLPEERMSIQRRFGVL